MLNQQSEQFSRQAHDLLRTLTGDPSSTFRPGQLEAIQQLVERRSRVLLVQRTGWGKSAVYFIATRLLRDQDAGPTLLISPLLALMRNQIQAAERLGVQAASINSANNADWEEVYDALSTDQVDVLLISPERLANPDFMSRFQPLLTRHSGLLVVDEVHCISDWGHDFRPDYRRIKRVLNLLPRGVPVLGCTATANVRVIDDVSQQLGAELVPIRGPLGRNGLRLRAFAPESQPKRLAWLAETIPRAPGTGIVYCLTVRDAERVAEWLVSQEIDAVEYTGSSTNEHRLEVERRLLNNQVKVVAATSALGMGFDKPDLSFVIHFQAPSSPILYYQQVGRAGRALDRSWGILLQGPEDTEIQNFFIESAFPSYEEAREVVDLLEGSAGPMKLSGIERAVNIRRSRLEALLRMLEIEGAVELLATGGVARRWRRTLEPWSFDRERVEAVTALGKQEQSQMVEYARTDQCRMSLLRSFLDDPESGPCGICDNCRSDRRDLEARTATIDAAIRFLRGAEITIEPLEQYPDGTSIPTGQLSQDGRALAHWGDGGRGTGVREGRASGHFADELVEASAYLIRNRWGPHPAPTWVTYVPSRRDPALLRDFARRLARLLDLPCRDAVVRVQDTEPQREMQNSSQQYANINGAFAMDADVPPEPVLLVDDVVDSRWTFTVIASLLCLAGAGPVYPFALADAQGRS